jgi:hypothetical protein
MRKHNLILGLFGGVLCMAVGPGLLVGGYHFVGVGLFIIGLLIVDYNRGGN